MPFQPLPCEPGGGEPGENTGCCAASIAAGQMCLADGTPILLVVRSGCADCGSTPADPQVVGWIDPATGAYTPGPPPAGAGPCQTAGCVDTVCVQRCDDRDGDGQADATYTELWCIREDGTTALVLTYGPDPSVPYTPVAPGECTYGCPESQTVMLCDAGGPFLRRYIWLNGSAAYEDVALDGQTPHLVTGTVGACPAGQDCAATPDPLAAVGLCLADGTPIAVIITRDCTGPVTRHGWINLSTGQYSAGAPPAGAQACGDGRAFELSGTLCDVAPGTGTVHAVVLVQYSYNPDGSLASVQLIDPSTGGPYLLQGQLRPCPAGAGQPDPDLIVLCDVRADGTAVPFLRDLRRDGNGLIVGYTDYTLDGSGYEPSGTPGLCAAPQAEQPCAPFLLTECRWDDTDGDGLGDTPYVELIRVDGCTGELTGIGTVTDDLSGPYLPVSPTTECLAGGAPAVTGAQARRAQLQPGQSWSAGAHPTLQAVAAAAHGGTATITTTDGASTLHDGETASWALIRPEDAALAGPLTITADTGTVVITFSTGVVL